MFVVVVQVLMCLMVQTLCFLGKGSEHWWGLGFGLVVVLICLVVSLMKPRRWLEGLSCMLLVQMVELLQQKQQLDFAGC